MIETNHVRETNDVIEKDHVVEKNDALEKNHVGAGDSPAHSGTQLRRFAIPQRPAQPAGRLSSWVAQRFSAAITLLL